MLEPSAGAAVAAFDRRGRIPRALVRFGQRRPKLTLLAWALLGALAIPGVARLQIETSTDSVLDRRGVKWAQYQDSQRRFGGDEMQTLVARWRE